MELHLQVHHSRKARTRRCSHTVPKPHAVMGAEEVSEVSPQSPLLKGRKSLSPRGETTPPPNLWHSEDLGEAPRPKLPRGKQSPDGARVASLSPGARPAKQDWESLSQEEELPGPMVQKGQHQEASKTGQGLMELQLEPVQA